MEAILVVLVIVWVLCGIFCCTIADSKGHDAMAWLFLGFLFGPLAILILVAMPEGGAGRPVAESNATIVPVSTASPASVADELEKLADLKDRGALSDEEFAKQKARILS